MTSFRLTASVSTSSGMNTERILRGRCRGPPSSPQPGSILWRSEGHNSLLQASIESRGPSDPHGSTCLSVPCPAPVGGRNDGRSEEQAIPLPPSGLSHFHIRAPGGLLPDVRKTSPGRQVPAHPHDAVSLGVVDRVGPAHASGPPRAPSAPQDVDVEEA